MTSDTEALLSAAEEETAALVDRLLAEMADEIDAALDDATEIVAARFRLSSIAAMWQAKVPRLMRRLFRVAGQASVVAEEDTGGTLPEGWDDLPQRFEDDTLPPGLDSYAEATQAFLDAVGDHMAEAAITALNEGLAEGEDTAQLKARLRALFSTTGTELGPYRSELISTTEATRAWNASTFAAAKALTGLARPLVKQWVTRGDNKVRHAHRDTNGQLQLLDDAFDVGGTPMDYPGDPTAPANQVCNCRCGLQLSLSPEELNATAAPDVHPGGMIALIPTAEDASRLAIEGGEAADELHCTLFFLTPDAADWSAEDRAGLVEAVRRHAAYLEGPVAARLFGVNHWNPGSDSPAWVWATGDDPGFEGAMLDQAHNIARDAVLSLERPGLPEQHTPWVAHVTARYGQPDDAATTAMLDRLGPVTFDRIRVVFAGEVTDIPLTVETDSMNEPEDTALSAADAGLWPVRTWTTPGDTALAFEDEQTGDGRVFAPGSLYWEDGPWPLQFADEMGEGHSGAELAGAITALDRDGNRIPGEGVLYMTQDAGWEAAMLLDQNAPLGVSVDLDDVDMEILEAPGVEGPSGTLAIAARTRIGRLSVMAMPDGGLALTASDQAVAASGTSLIRSTGGVQVLTGPGGAMTREAALALAPEMSQRTAAAGDPAPTDGTVVAVENAGDYLCRITRGRVRGATLVVLPAYSRARIVIDPEEPGSGEERPLYAEDVELAASGAGVAQVVKYVTEAFAAVTVKAISDALGMSPSTVRRHLRTAVEEGKLVKLGRSQYAAAITDLSAAASGKTDLPVAPRETEWDGAAAAESVFGWASDADGNVDPAKAGDAFFWYDPAAPELRGSYKLGFARLQDGALQMVPDGVFAAAAAVQGARGGVDIPEADMDGVKAKIKAAYATVSEALGEEHTVPWEAMSDESDAKLEELEASVWTAMRDTEPMPAAWFKEPTAEELPPGSGGVHYQDGRVFGWVAQAGVPHAAHGPKVTIDKLAAEGLDTSHFLRAKFPLDDGTQVKAGAFTMNVGHHRDGFECETAACQFDDSRTVGGIVTVGLNEGGLWFSGAASPWMSDWDRQVFKATQPSYHLVRGRDDRWQLRGILSVPVPGHSSPLTAAAVIDRSNLALTAAATAVLDRDAERDVPTTESDAGVTPDRDGSLTSVTSVTQAVTAALSSPEFLDGLAAAMDRRAADKASAVERLAALKERMSGNVVTQDTAGRQSRGTTEGA